MQAFSSLRGDHSNSAANTIAQPQEKPLSGNGIDQTMQFGDVIEGTDNDDVLIGRLGVDVMIAGSGNDVLIGGPEHFKPQNRDRAFGGNGDDIFIWSPGDGSDFFDGGRGKDVVVFGLIGQREGDIPVFAVRTDQKAGEVILDRNYRPAHRRRHPPARLRPDHRQIRGRRDRHGVRRTRHHPPCPLLRPRTREHVRRW